MTKERRLGRGLAALLGEPLPAHAESERSAEAIPPEATTTSPDAHAEGAADDVAMVLLNVYEIDDNPFQPRRDFSKSEIMSLAASLKEHDMLQPIVVRRVRDRYQLISGERRLRAAIQAGWAKVPARVWHADDRLVAELAIVENLQRQDLNAIEKALSFQRYIREHGCTQEDLASRIKIDRSTIANLMRLLELPELVRESLRSGSISAGHARALLPLGEERAQIEFSQRIQSEGLSVRETERKVQERICEEDSEALSVVDGSPTGRARQSRNGQVNSLEQELRSALGTKVEIRQTSRGRGRIVVHFTNNGEFDRLHRLMTEWGRTHHEAG